MMLMMAGLHGLSGPTAQLPVAVASSKGDAHVIASTATVRARLCRQETATCRNVTSAVSHITCGNLEIFYTQDVNLIF